MLARFVSTIINRPIATTVVFLAVGLAGAFSLLRLPLEIFPTMDFPRLYILTTWHGASPFQIEAQVTSRIEAELSTIAQINKIKSTSHLGYSRIELQLQRNADVALTRFLIQERLALVMEELPDEVLPPRIEKYVPEEFETVHFLSYHIVGVQDDAYLRQLALRQIVPRLNGVEGVAGCEVIGGRTPQVMVIVDLDKLRGYSLSIQRIQQVIQESHRVQTVGQVLESGREALLLFHQTIPSLYELERLPVHYANQRWLLLRDVAVVKDTLSPPYSLQRINNKSTVLLQIHREPQSNTIRTANRVYRIIEQLRQRLPEGVELIKEDDQSQVIRENLRQLFYRAALSFLVIFLVLTLFIRYFRFSLLIQSSILISILFTFLLMLLFRHSLNIITLAGLALGFGILVDNAIVVIENISRLREKGSDLAESCIRGVSQVALSVAASTLTTLVALFPFLYFAEELRIYYTPFAITVSLALLASLAVSFVLIPVISNRVFPSSAFSAHAPTTAGNLSSRLSRLLGNAYAWLLERSLAHPALVVILIIWLFGIPVWKLPDSLTTSEDASIFKRTFTRYYNDLMQSSAVQGVRPYLNHLLGGSTHLFYRYVHRGELWTWGEQTMVQAWVRFPSGTEIEETDRVVQLLEQTVLGSEGVAQIRSHIYPHYAYVSVNFHPDFEHSAIPYLTKERLIVRATRIGNAAISVTGYGPGFSSGAGATWLENRLVLSGYNYKQLTDLAEEMKTDLEAYSRVRNVRTDLTRQYLLADVFETTLYFNRSALGDYGMSAAEVFQQLQPILSPFSYRQRLTVGGEEKPFTLTSHQQKIVELHSLDELPVSTASGNDVRLKSLANQAQKALPPLIERENQEYYLVIAFDYLAPYRFAQQFVDDFLEKTDVPVGFKLEKMSGFWLEVGDKLKIVPILILSFLLIYMVLAGLYESFSYPLLIFLVIPFSLIGVFLIYYLTGATFNQEAYIGLIFMFGIILNNAILLLDRINQIKLSGEFSQLRQVLMRACGDRLRPILMTTITTILGLLPLLIIRPNAGEQDIWFALSLSTIGGLTSGTILSLLAFPAFVWIVEKNLFRIRSFLSMVH